MRKSCDGGLRRAPRRKNPISLTPLIDVVFILLMFYMLTSHFDRWQSVPINVSLATGESHTNTPTLNLYISNDGLLRLNGKFYPLSALSEQSVVKIARQHNWLVSLAAADMADIQMLTSTLDELALLGFNRVSIVP